MTIPKMMVSVTVEKGKIMTNVEKFVHLIDRDKVIEAIDDISVEIDEGYGFQYEKWRKYFCELPGVSRKGKWIITSTFDDCYYAKCDQCHETQVFYYNKPLTNFCPNCGADMREGD